MKVKYERVVDGKLASDVEDLAYLRIEFDLCERVHNMPSLRDDSLPKVMTTHHIKMDILVDECSIHVRSLDSRGSVLSITTHELFHKQLGIGMQTCRANMHSNHLHPVIALGCEIVDDTEQKDVT